MGDLGKRLQRLEGLRRCPACGWPPPPGEKIALDIHWPDIDEEPDPEEELPCSVCGKSFEITMTWTDLDEDYYGEELHGW